MKIKTNANLLTASRPVSSLALAPKLSSKQIRQSYPKRLAHSIATTNSFATVLIMLGLATSLSACQSTAVSKSSNSAMTHTSKVMDNPSQFAKSTLNRALQQQSRSAYAYQSNITMSNQNRRDALDRATPLQLAMADDKKDHCDVVHDHAYVALLQHAKQQGNDINDGIYSQQLNTIEQENIKCVQNLKIWEASQDKEAEYEYSEYEQLEYEESAYEQLEPEDSEYEQLEYEDSEYTDLDSPINEDDNSDYYVEDDAIYEDDQSADEHDLTQEKYGKFDTPERREAYANQDYLPDYDSKHTKQDVKNAKLIDAYLLRSLNLEAQGVYQPSRGVMTAVPSIQYKTRNQIIALNQPLYFDAKTGSIYVWADNFGYAVARLLDTNLGTQWQNKWLKINIEDGSLPKGFTKNLIMTHLNAIKLADSSLDKQHFALLDTNNLQTLSPNVSANALTTILNQSSDDKAAFSNKLTDQSLIIERQFDKQSFDRYKIAYYRNFHNDLMQQYPELGKQSDTPNEYNTKKMVEMLLSHMKHSIDAYDTAHTNDEIPVNNTEYESAISIKTISAQEDMAEKQRLSQSSLVDYAKNPQADSDSHKNPFAQSKPSSIAINEYYGLNKQHNIVWQLKRLQLPDNKNETEEGLTIDIFTQYSAIDNSTKPYPNLPDNVQTPNAKNSVELDEYSKTLMASYEDGNGTPLGELLLSAIPMMQLALAMSMEDID